MRNLLARLKRRNPTTSRPGAGNRDWTSNWTPRDWADLPTHHPRSDNDAA